MGAARAPTPLSVAYVHRRRCPDCGHVSRRDPAQFRRGLSDPDDPRSPGWRVDGTVARASRQQCSGPRPGNAGRVDELRCDRGPGPRVRAGDDGPPPVLFPPRDGGEPRGLRLHPGCVPRRADGRHGPRHPSRAPPPSGGPSLVDPDAVLFPLFSGLFGIPSLLLGLRARPGSIPYQRVEPLRALSPEDARSALRGTIAGASVSWLPGLSGGAAATLASVGTRKSVGPSQFMVVLGAVSTSTALLSVAVLFIIHRARSGAAAAVRALAGDLSPWPSVWAAPVSLLLLVMSAVFATAIAAPIAAQVGRAVARRWSSSNPRRIAALSLLAVLLLLAAATGPVGIGLAGLAAIVGLVPVVLRVRRVHLMASLLVPVLLTYLGPGG